MNEIIIDEKRLDVTTNLVSLSVAVAEWYWSPSSSTMEVSTRQQTCLISSSSSTTPRMPYWALGPCHCRCRPSRTRSRRTPPTKERWLKVSANLLRCTSDFSGYSGVTRDGVVFHQIWGFVHMSLDLTLIMFSNGWCQDKTTGGVPLSDLFNFFRLATLDV